MSVSLRRVTGCVQMEPLRSAKLMLFTRCDSQRRFDLITVSHSAGRNRRDLQGVLPPYAQKGTEGSPSLEDPSRLA